MPNMKVESSQVRALLNRCENYFGSIDADIRARLKAVIDNPSEATWEDAYSIILNPHTGIGRTLWQAVIAVDLTFPNTGPCTDAKGKRLEGWSKIPTRETILNAILYAVTEQTTVRQ